MKRGFYRTLLLLAVTTAAASAQESRLPRDPQKLVERAQTFWAAIVRGHRLEALGFVLPEKREVFLSESPTPVARADVVGLNLTNRPDRAQVRVSIETFTKDAMAAHWEITDSWVWDGKNWYLDLRDAPDIFPRRNHNIETDVSEIEKKIDQNFQLLRNPVDLGRLVEGEHLRFNIPIKYSADIPVSAESELENTLADFDAASTSNITSETDYLVLLVNTEGWEGPFDLPLPIKIRNGAATVKRTVVVRGTVFAPITFRQEPPGGPIPANRPFSLFVRNNSSQEVGVVRIRTDSKFEIVKRPDKLLPNVEAEVVLKLNPDQSPDRLYLEIDTPIEERTTFTYRFPGNR